MAENTKKWEETGRRYRTYIKLEKRLSQNNGTADKSGEGEIQEFASEFQ